MYPRDSVAAGPEEQQEEADEVLEETEGAKAGLGMGPGLSLLQQVGCWHLNLSNWVSDAALLSLLFNPLRPFGD